MTKVVGHWAVVRKMTDRHACMCTTNVILVQNKEAKKNSQRMFTSISLQNVPRKGISSLTLAVEM